MCNSIKSSVCSDPSVFHLFSRAFDSSHNGTKGTPRSRTSARNSMFSSWCFRQKLRPFNPVTQFHPSTGETRNPCMASRISFYSLPRYEFNYFYQLKCQSWYQELNFHIVTPHSNFHVIFTVNNRQLWLPELYRQKYGIAKLLVLQT